MRIKIAINGFGRIGRCLLHAVYEFKKADMAVVAINSNQDVDQCVYYAKYDSVYGRSKSSLKFDRYSSIMHCDGDDIHILRNSDPSEINWDKYGVDVVMECTGKLNSLKDASGHLKYNMKKVLVSAPVNDANVTVVYGVNHFDIKNNHMVVSAASCTTNCFAVVAKVLSDCFGIESGHMITIHSYTNGQSLVDSGDKDLYRSRAAALSIIPSTTGAAKNINLVLPELTGRVSSSAVRVPTPAVSMIDFVFLAKKNITVEDINNEFIRISKNEMKGILDVCNESLVSLDFIGNIFGAVIDLKSTKSIGANLYRVVAWYDNEFAFAFRMLETACFWCNNV